MNKAVCHYSVIRFLPYRAAEEFVNVGVLLLCEATGFLRFRLETRRHKRITDFFNELDERVFRIGVRGLETELWQTVPRVHTPHASEPVLPGTASDLRRIFDFLVRPRRTLFFLSEPRVVASADPASTLNTLFGHYVERRFAQTKEYQEELMKEAIQIHLTDWKLASSFRPLEFKNDVYRMRFPFVHSSVQEDGKSRAIRPLHLGLRDTTEILRKGDLLVGGLKRLVDAAVLPPRCLFVVKRPRQDSKSQRIAEEVCDDLRSLGMELADFADKPALKNFAESAKSDS